MGCGAPHSPLNLGIPPAIPREYKNVEDIPKMNVIQKGPPWSKKNDKHLSPKSETVLVT